MGAEGKVKGQERQSNATGNANYDGDLEEVLYPDHEENYQALFTSDDPTGRRRRKVVDHPALHRVQRKHFLLFDVLPIFGTIAAIALIPTHAPTLAEIAVAIVMWIITGFGISVGYHRLFAHASFKTSTWLEVAFAIAGAMAGQGGLISWVAMHRRHHEFGDQVGDLHSPNLSGNGLRGKIAGFCHSHFSWMAAHPYPNVVHYAPDLLKNRTLAFVNRHYYRWVWLGFLAPALVCAAITQSWWGLAMGVLWGGFVRMFVLEHGIWSLNSICHLFGTKRFITGDQSRNNWWLAPFIFGEAWHHNHHAFPNSASFGLTWYRIDPGFWLIKTLAILGLAREIKIPNAQQQSGKLIAA